MSNAAAIAIRDGPIRAAIVFEFAMDCLPARCRCGTSTDKNTHREEPVRRSAAPVRHRPTAVGNEPKRNARRPCMITQRLGAEEGDTPVEQQPAAMQDFDPTYDRCGSFTSFPLSRRVRFAPRADFGNARVYEVDDSPGHHAAWMAGPSMPLTHSNLKMVKIGIGSPSKEQWDKTPIRVKIALNMIAAVRHSLVPTKEIVDIVDLGATALMTATAKEAH